MILPYENTISENKITSVSDFTAVMDVAADEFTDDRKNNYNQFACARFIDRFEKTFEELSEVNDWSAADIDLGKKHIWGVRFGVSQIGGLWKRKLEQ